MLKPAPTAEPFIVYLKLIKLTKVTTTGKCAANMFESNNQNNYNDLTKVSTKLNTRKSGK